ncbi:MAG TPA: transposase [Ignavibacteria bacterium]|nr:transposase [Ignavibacteria bacterium]
MPYRKQPIVRGNYYHIYNRGNNRENIFFEDRNYEFFIRRIKENFPGYAELVTYCLMPNHFHLIAYIISDKDFYKALRKTFISYTKAINQFLGRTGHLFEGRYKYKLVPENNYLLHLSRYIHLNPVRAGLVDKPGKWRYSSYLTYIGKQKDDFIKNGIILEQVKDYEDFVIKFQEEQNYFVKPLMFG